MWIYANCCSLTRGPPHSTTLLALADVQRIALNLGGSCQNLERILAISAAILAAKWNCIRSFQRQEILENSCKNGPQTIKIHQNCQKWRPTKKNSPQDRKRAKKGASVTEVGDPPGHPKSAKIRKKGVSKIDVFFDPLLEPTLPHFRLPQAPQK